MRPAIASGIVTGGAGDSYWPIVYWPIVFPRPFSPSESLLFVSKVEKYCFRSILTFFTAFTHTHNAPVESYPGCQRRSSLVASPYGRSCVGLRPTPKIPAAREKNLWYPG